MLTHAGENEEYRHHHHHDHNKNYSNNNNVNDDFNQNVYFSFISVCWNKNNINIPP